MIKPKKSVENMSGYSTPLFEDEYEYKLDGNENNFGPSSKVLECISDIQSCNIQFYPIYGELLQKLGATNNLPSEYFLCTNGADEAISVIFITYLDKGDKVLTVTPSFAMPKIYAQIVDAQYIEVPYNTKWQFPEDAFLKAMDENPDAKIIHLTTPNNPTGDVISRGTIIKIIEKAQDKIVVIDETYANYCGELNTDLAQKYDNVIITRSFSKDFALAGLRIGYIISNPENINQLIKVRSPYSTNAIAIKAAIAALCDTAHLQKICAEVSSNKIELQKFFEQQGFVVYPTKANFLLVDFGEKADFIYKKLLENSIKIKKFETPEILKNNCRITIPNKNGIEKIKAIILAAKRSALVFDMDGVLIDTRNSYRIAISETFKFFTNKEISSEEIQSAKNSGRLNNDWDLTEYLLKSAGYTVAKAGIVEKFQDIYWNNGQGLIKDEKLLIDKALLEQLSTKYNLAIFTGRPRLEAEFALKNNAIEQYFYPVITMDDLPADKQKPDCLGLDIVKEKIMFDKMYYLGDTPDDMLCAGSAQVKAVGVLPPQDKSEDLKNRMTQSANCAIINDVNEILSVLECKNA